MTNEKIYILMDAQNPCDWDEVTLEEARQHVRNTWAEWEEITEEQFASIDDANADKVESMLAGYDYRLFNSQEERKQWLEEVQLEYVEE